jgi:hypothetical protein
MTTLNNYYNQIRSDIAKEYGLEAGGFAPRPRYELPIRVAQRINDKYPATWVEGQFRPTPNPMAIRIAKRYVSLMKAGVIK